MKRTFGVMACGILLSACSAGDDGGSKDFAADPALETDAATLEAALHCLPFHEAALHEPILLVHGTFTGGDEQWSWNYMPYLDALGYDVCNVTYPDRGYGDQQISAEYVVHALRRIHEMTGRKVDMVGHSQGASMPRWALRWWPGLHDIVDDFVMLAAPNHGTKVAALPSVIPGGMPEAFWQFAPDSNFVRAMNSGDETPGAISYTSIYTLTDELVQPQLPESTSALDLGHEEASTVNILLQDVCPGRPVDHVLIGLTDSTTMALVLDALANPGPADVERAGGIALCLDLSFVDPVVAAMHLQGAGGGFFGSFPSEMHSASEEPPLKPYAAGY